MNEFYKQRSLEVSLRIKAEVLNEFASAHNTCASTWFLENRSFLASLVVAGEPLYLL